MILRVIGFLVLILSMSAAARACACSQAPPGKCPGLQQDDVVFLGTVTAAEDIAYATPPSESSAKDAASASGSTAPTVDIIASRLTRYHFHIDERFAGPDAPEIDIFSGGDDGDCGYRFKLQEQYVVFTHPGGDGRLFATICNGTRPASGARALLPQLRAMRNGQRVASVFGVLRRAYPPFLAPQDDPDDPLPNISLKLRSRDDRFETSTDSSGVYSFYDVHAGQYSFTANLPPRTELTQKTLTGGLPPFKIPNGACFEYDVAALPTGHIRGSVLDPKGKPLAIASLELYRAGSYDDSRPGLWAFQGSTGFFDFDHVGPGQYVLVFNRANRMDPNAPFHRAFYPGVADAADAKTIKIKDGQELLKVNLQEGCVSIAPASRPFEMAGSAPAGKRHRDGQSRSGRQSRRARNRPGTLPVHAARFRQLHNFSVGGLGASSCSSLAGPGGLQHSRAHRRRARGGRRLGFQRKRDHSCIRKSGLW
ncbi:MAG: hypothetical protein ABSG27_13490 [Candidatus Acidiferrales bacterium]